LNLKNKPRIIVKSPCCARMRAPVSLYIPVPVLTGLADLYRT